MTIQLKRAWAALIIATAMLVSVVVLLLRMDTNLWCLDESTRHAMYGIFIVGGLLYGLVVLLMRPRGHQVQTDERDTVIRRKAMVVQWWAVFVTTLVWANALTKMYYEECAVPVKYLWFIFWSTVLISLIAQSAGIIIGYWKVDCHE